MSSSCSSKSVLLWSTCCVFGGGNIAGSTLRKVPHLAMCGDFTLFMGCNIFWVLIVAIFPTTLVSPHLEFICKSYSSFRFAAHPRKRLRKGEKGFWLQSEIVLGNFHIPEFPSAPRKVLQKWLRKSLVLLLTPAGISELSLTGISGWPEFPSLSRPEFPDDRNFRVSLIPEFPSVETANGYISWRGINTSPLLLPQQIQGSTTFPSLLLHCWPWKAHFPLNPSIESSIFFRESWEEI